ncbi:MAG: 3-phosphoshikimate 1-carboxyvinyltransferase [Fusobacteriaceae bacterium]
MIAKIIPNQLSGEINIPPSKSYSHRAIIAAALSEGKSEIGNIDFSVDIKTTIEIMRNIGAEIIEKKNSLEIIGNGGKISIKEKNIQCNESGSSIRFLIPVLMAGKSCDIIIDGKGKLKERPLNSYYEIFDKQKINYSTTDGKLPLKINGTLKAGIFEIDGNISSQFITGLLYTLPLLDGDSKIIIRNNLESKGYVDLTIDILELAGIKIKNNNYESFEIEGNQKYKAFNYTVEGDYSQVAFWIVAGLIGKSLTCKNIFAKSLQGDKEIIEIVKRMKGKLEIETDKIKVFPSETKGTIIDISECPDIGPILTVLGTFSEGETRIINGARLRIKESDRITSIRTELNKLGGKIEEVGDSLIIQGVKSLKGGVEVDAWNDHRIAMSLAVASIRCENPITITGAESVRKSYPNFWDEFKSVGGKVEIKD